LYVVLISIDLVSVKLLAPAINFDDHNNLSVFEILVFLTILEILVMILYSIIGVFSYLVHLLEMAISVDFESKDTVFKILMLVASVVRLG